MTDQQSPYASGPPDPSQPPLPQAYPAPEPLYGYAEPTSGQPSAQPGYGRTGYDQPGYGAVAYGPPPYGQPGYGVDPATGRPWSDKSRTTAGLLSLLLPLVGVCGVGRLYSGQIGLGLAQLLGFFAGCVLMVVLIGFVIAPAVWIWSVVDGIVLLASGGKDRFGRPLR